MSGEYQECMVGGHNPPCRRINGKWVADPWLECERLGGIVAKLKSTLEMVEYVGDAAEGMEGFAICPWCESEPHADDCVRQLALQETE